MVVQMHPVSCSAGRDGVSRKQINLHPGGHLGVQQQVKTRGWLRSRADWHSVVAEGFGETPQPARACKPTASSPLARGLVGSPARAPASRAFPGFGAVEQFGVLGCAGEHPLLCRVLPWVLVSPPQLPSGCLGWMLVAHGSARAPRTDSSHRRFGVSA